MRKNNYTNIDGYIFPQLFSDNKGYAIQHNLKGIARIKFWIKIYWNFFKANQRLRQTIRVGKCYYGPFKGEYGHMLAHTAPFLMYLHKHGVKVIYCGMELHKPLLVDENGNSIIYDFRPLRDFFHEVSPRSNNVIPPIDVQNEIKKFENEARGSGLPYWNIGDDYYYWFIHRNWLLNKHTHVYNLRKVYQTKDENACCIFPRSKGSKQSPNNGGPWDYSKIIELIKPYFDKIYITGHPSQVLDIEPSDKVEICITADNAKIYEKVANSNLLITQHSGVNNLGEYLNCKVLIIYNGGKTVSDISSMNNTLRFRKSLGNKYPLAFAFTEEEIVNFVKKHTASFKENKNANSTL